MPLITRADAPVFDIPGASFVGLASPSRGATETAAWTLTIAPGAPGLPHRLTREETFIVLEGQAVAAVGGTEHTLSPGCALIVPANTDFALSNPGATPFKAVAMMAVGGQAILEDGACFTPPWAA